MTVYSLPLPWDTLSLFHTRTLTRTHTRIYNLTDWKWTSGEMQPTVGQFSRKVAKRGDKVTWGLTGADAVEKPQDHADTAGGESWGWAEETLLPGYRQAAQRDHSELSEPPLIRPVGVSHTPTHTHTRVHLMPLALRLPALRPAIKSVNGGQRELSGEEKNVAGSDGRISSPWGELTSRAVIHAKASQAAQAVSRTPRACWEKKEMMRSCNKDT